MKFSNVIIPSKMDSLSKLHIDCRKKLLRIFLLELSQLESVCDRDRFLLKTLHQHLNLEPEAIVDVKNEVRKLLPSERKNGKMDLQNVLLKIKIEIAHEMDKEQAIWFLGTLKNLLNVGGTLSDDFIQNLCSDYLPNKVSTKNSLSTSVEDKDLEGTSDGDLSKPNLLSIGEASNTFSEHPMQEPIINNTEQLNNTFNTESIKHTTNSPKESKDNDQKRNDPFQESKFEYLVELLQRIIFPVRDAMITSLRVDTTIPTSNDIEDHIASIQMRLIALVMDCLIVAFGLLIPAACIIPVAVLLQTINLELVAVIFTILPGLAIIFYFFNLEYKYQATFGKQWMGLKICSDSGKKPASKISILRILFKMLPIISSSLATLLSLVYPPLMSLAMSLTLLFWFFIFFGIGLIFVNRKSKGFHDMIFKTLVIYSEKIPK